MGGKSGNGNRLEQSESQRLEALAGNYRLIALVQTTRLTGGYDYQKTPVFTQRELAFYSYQERKW